MSLDHYPLNPDYGKGIFRRRIRLIGEAGLVTTLLDDDYHSMWARLSHDGSVVTAAEAALFRFPKNTCGAAPRALQEIVGTPLAQERRAFFGNGRTARNCTHLLDLSLVMLRHARLGTRSRVIDIAVTDRVEDIQHLHVAIDGRAIHDWTLEGNCLIAPEAVAGQSLMTGFAAWADGHFCDDALEAARMLQKAVFVARGRRYLVDQAPPHRATEEPHRLGDCFTFSEPQFSEAVSNLGYVRDFTAGLVESTPMPLGRAEL